MKKTFLLIVLLMAVAILQAATNRTWSGAGDGSTWGDAANWDGGVPDADSRYIFVNQGTVEADNVSASTTEHMYVGNSGTNASLTFNSGNLTVSGVKHLMIGEVGSVGTLIMNGGTIDTQTSTVGLGLGHGGTGYLTMNGGVITGAYFRTTSKGTIGGNQILLTGGELRPERFYLGSGANTTVDTMVVDNGGWFNSTNLAQIGASGEAVMTVKAGGTAEVRNALTLGFNTGSSGILNMEGGTCEVGSLVVGSSGTGEVNLTGGSLQTDALTMNAEAVMDIAGGELVLLGNITDITTYGNVLAYSGDGSLVYDYDAGSNYTTISAVPEPATLALLGLGGLLIRRKRA